MQALMRGKKHRDPSFVDPGWVILSVSFPLKKRDNVIGRRFI
jgi:hypothetical protein